MKHNFQLSTFNFQLISLALIVTVVSLTSCTDDLTYDDLTAADAVADATDNPLAIGVTATVGGEQTVSTRSATAVRYDTVEDLDSFYLVVLDTTAWDELMDYYLAYTIDPTNDTLVRKFRYFINEIKVKQKDGKFYTDSTYLWRAITDHCILWAYAPTNAFSSTFMAEFDGAVKRYQELATQYQSMISSAQSTLSNAQSELEDLGVSSLEALQNEVDSLQSVYEADTATYHKYQADSIAAIQALEAAGGDESYIVGDDGYLESLVWCRICFIYLSDTEKYGSDDYTYAYSNTDYTYEGLYAYLFGSSYDMVLDMYGLMLGFAVEDYGGTEAQWSAADSAAGWAITYAQTVKIDSTALAEKQATLDKYNELSEKIAEAKATISEYETMAEFYTNMANDASLALRVEAWNEYYLKVTGEYPDTFNTRKTFTVPSDQRDSTAVTDLLLWSDLDYVPEEDMMPEDDPQYVQVDFHHALAKLTLNLVLKDELLEDTVYTTATGEEGTAPSWDENQIDTVMLYPAAIDTLGIVDPLDEEYYDDEGLLTLKAGGQTGKIYPWVMADTYTAPKKQQDGAVSYRCMLIPQEIGASTTTTDRRNGWGVRIYIQGQLHDWYADETFQFEGGKHYILTLQVGEDVVYMESTTVESWDDDTEALSYDTHD